MPEVTPICQFGTKAIPFNLKAIDGKIYNLEQIKGKNGTLIMFICNHCPYVKAVINNIVKDVKYFETIGIFLLTLLGRDFSKLPRLKKMQLKRVKPV